RRHAAQRRAAGPGQRPRRRRARPDADAAGPPHAAPIDARAVAIAGLACWRHDLESGRISHNDEARKIIGAAASPEGMTIQELGSRVHPDDRAAGLAASAAALAGDRATDTDLRMRSPDGHWRTILTRRGAERDGQGRAVAITGVGIDISEREDATRQAVELGRRFELATRFAGIGYWSIENLQEPAQWSEQMRALHGLAKGEPAPTLRQWMDRFIEPRARAESERTLAEWARAGFGNLQRDMRIVRADGEVRHLMTHSSGEVHGARTLLFGLVIDITERKNAARALRQADERAALVARSVGIGTWVLDHASGVSYWDEQMWRLRGLEPRPDAPSTEGRMAIIHPDDRERVARHQEESLVADEAPSHYEYRVVLPDGRERWLASRSMAERDADGRALRRIGVNWDVTDRRNAEAARQGREVALRESEAKSEFLSRMSHELRTPLNGVLGFAQLLLAEEGGDDPPAALRRRRIEQIRAAGARLLALINDALDLSSLERDELRIAAEPVALAPLVQQVLPQLEALRREHRVEIETGPLDAVVRGDPARLRQVLVNLLSNAVKYNRPGGRVTVEARRGAGRVRLSVADNGRGMTAQQIEHLFEPFNRLGVADEPIEGTGIGLAIAKALVERMGGTVQVQSRVGAGSCFELTLADAQAPASPRGEVAPARAHGIAHNGA
ncbi:MAG: PAS domain-containing protein, partial [Burkholderiales bacterium]|nr:PAS domain-containing protein [Burkholderiales bacterium]